MTFEPASKPRLTFEAVTWGDFEELAALRIAAMRDSLTRIGRFDLDRARERLRNSFCPEETLVLAVEGERIGFYALRRDHHAWSLDHLYLHPAWQSHGIGSLVLDRLCGEADRCGATIRVGALRESASNRFYMRHGFRVAREEEWDIYYERSAQPHRAEIEPDGSSRPV